MNDEMQDAILDLISASRQVGMSDMSMFDTQSQRDAVLQEESDVHKKVLEMIEGLTTEG